MGPALGKANLLPKPFGKSRNAACLVPSFTWAGHPGPEYQKWASCSNPFFQGHFPTLKKKIFSLSKQQLFFWK
jgi:hypothetical protein